MYLDMFGKPRMKINFHMHTTDSDGRFTPEQAAQMYKALGYDAIAITDHWAYQPGGELAGLRVLPGAEYDLGGYDIIRGVCHIVSLGCHTRPQLRREGITARAIVEETHRCGGLAILAHPAWSVNLPHQFLGIPFDGMEIYNSISDAGNSNRPYAGYFADAAMSLGMCLPLLAADDTHYYTGEDTGAYVMLECPENASDDEILQAVREEKFYATQGPEVHLHREGNEIIADCSPASRICFFSASTYTPGHSTRGEGLTQARTTVEPFETAIRAEVTDAEGRMAWSNFLKLKP